MFYSISLAEVTLWLCLGLFLFYLFAVSDDCHCCRHISSRSVGRSAVKRMKKNKVHLYVPFFHSVPTFLTPSLSPSYSVKVHHFEQVFDIVRNTTTSISLHVPHNQTTLISFSHFLYVQSLLMCETQTLFIFHLCSSEICEEPCALFI